MVGFCLSGCVAAPSTFTPVTPGFLHLAVNGLSEKRRPKCYWDLGPEKKERGERESDMFACVSFNFLPMSRFIHGDSHNTSRCYLNTVMRQVMDTPTAGSFAPEFHPQQVGADVCEVKAARDGLIIFVRLAVRRNKLACLVFWDWLDSWYAVRKEECQIEFPACHKGTIENIKCGVDFRSGDL